MGIRIKIVCGLLVALGIGLAAATASGREDTPFAFKNRMHQLFYGYSHAWISLDMKRIDITDIHLKQAQSAIDELPEFLPRYRMDGTEFDRKLFLKRLDELRDAITSLRAAAQTAGAGEWKRISGGIFRMCVACHEEAKMDYLFRFPRGTRVLFQDYMHRVTENFDLLEFYLEEGEAGSEDAEDHLKLIGYYLELLKSAFPDAGPSGVIMDRDAAVARIKRLEALSGRMLDDVTKKRPVAVEDFRTTLNGFCVACHEPERIK